MFNQALKCIGRSFFASHSRSKWGPKGVSFSRCRESSIYVSMSQIRPVLVNKSMSGPWPWYSSACDSIFQSKSNK